MFTKSSVTQLRTDVYDYVIKSGRAVLFPIYKSTYERGDGLRQSRPNTTNGYREHVIEWSQDLVACRSEFVTADAAGGSEYFHRIGRAFAE